jgi:poly-gamma-glutamate capsule biosynthesis protein CapA/YwtB (metallophosphatase superfamily)
VTLGSAYGLPPDHARGMLAGVAPILRAADIAAVNLEGTFGYGGVSKCPLPPRAARNCFAFQAPAGNAAALPDAGIDIVNVANNHTMDFGAAGLRQTVNALRRRRVAFTGLRGQIRYLSRPGARQAAARGGRAGPRPASARVAFLGFSAYPWTSPIRDLRTVRHLVGEAARHADVVVAFMHAGAEGIAHMHTPNRDEVAFGELRGNARRFAHTAVDAGADLVLGSGPHVLRGMEVYRHRLIAYSLGNLAGYRNFARGGALSVSGLVRIRLGADGALVGGRLVPLRLVGPGLPVRDRARTAVSLVARLSRADFGPRAVHLSPSGRIVVAAPA